MLHSMTIRLIHVHQLEPLYLCYGVKGQPGVIWGHRGQKVIFTKNATSTDYMAWLCNSCIYIHKLETLYSIHGVKVNLGSLPPANIMRLCPDLFPDLVFFSFLSLLSKLFILEWGTVAHWLEHWIHDHKVVGTSHDSEFIVLSPWERLLTHIVPPHPGEWKIWVLASHHAGKVKQTRLCRRSSVPPQQSKVETEHFAFLPFRPLHTELLYTVSAPY